MKSSRLLKYFLLGSSLLSPMACFDKESQSIYPTAKKDVKLDDYFGHKVADPYRWMEQSSPELQQWIKRQRKVTEDYLQKIPERKDFAKRLEELLNFPRTGTPNHHSGYLYYTKNSGLDPHSQYYRLKKGAAAEQEELVLNPNTLSKDGSVAAYPVGYSKDGRYMAYKIQESGSDWNTFKVKDLTTKKDLVDELKWIKFSEATWYNRGFFYLRYPTPKEGDELSSANKNASVYYHSLGAKQEDDLLVHRNQESPKSYFSVQVSEDKSHLFIYEQLGTYGTKVLYRDNRSNPPKATALIDNFDNKHRVLHYSNSHIWLYTNKDAPNFRVVKVDLNKPQVEKWIDVIPHNPKHKLQEVSLNAEDKLITHYLVDVCSQLKVYDLEGKFLHEVKLPGVGAIDGIRGEVKDQEVYFAFENFTSPETSYVYHVNSNQLKVHGKSQFKANLSDFVTEQVFYQSKDGTKVPMFLAYKKGMKRDGTNPVLMTGYGGFDISWTPTFIASYVAWMEKGGIFAVANIRGGGEYGQTWHEAGMRFKKQNVFDDFIAAAEFLHTKKYTSPNHLTVYGGSNGGLLIGAVLNQRPNLFAAAIPAVGVMDMLKFQKFTIGHAWVSEYGSSEESEEMFKYLYAYSPLHNIKKDLKYPAIMVETADHDDRVVPAHSFKYAATLQEDYNSKKPRIIAITSKAGHGAGASLQLRIKKTADKFAFAWHNSKH